MAAHGVDPDAIGHEASSIGMLLLFATNLVVLGGCLNYPFAVDP
jgi:hypothetical protein